MHQLSLREKRHKLIFVNMIKGISFTAQKLKFVTEASFLGVQNEM